MATKAYTKVIKSDPAVLPELESYVLNILDEIKLDHEKVNSLVLSVAEAASNSILHGNKSNPDKDIVVTIKVNETKLEISIKDQGEGFEPSKVPDPTKPENILKDSGRGIHIMKSFLDDLRYNFTSEGTEVILVVNLK